MENKMSIMYAYYQKRKKVIWVSLLVLVFCYGYRLFNFNITLDNDLDLILAQQNPGENLNVFFFRNGRYLMGILRYLLSINGAFIPYASVFIGLAAMWLSTIVLCVIIDKITAYSERDLTLIAFISLFLSSPIPFTQTFAFDSTIDVGYIFVLIMNIGIYFMSNPSSTRKNIYLSGLILLIVSFLSNQYAVMLYISSFSMLLFIKIVTTGDITFKTIWKFSKPFIIDGMLGILGYVLVTVLIRKFTHIDSTYINSLVGWTNDSFLNCLRAIKSSIYDVFNLDKTTGSLYYSLMLIAMLIMMFKFALMKDRPLKAKVYIWGAALLLVASIFSLPMALGSKVSLRHYVGIPYFMGIIAFALLHALKNSKYWRSLFCMFIVFVFICQALSMNLSFYSSYQTAELEKIYIHQIAHDIIKKNDGQMPTKPVLFVGDYSVDPPSMVHKEAVGSRMLAWYEPERKHNAFSVYGYRFNNSLIYDQSANDQAKIISYSMNCWPAEDSIYIGERFIVVKLSGQSYSLSRANKNISLEEMPDSIHENVNISITTVEQRDMECIVYGWANILGKDSSYTKMSMAFVGDSEQYNVPLVIIPRYDVDIELNSNRDGIYNYSGIDAKIPLYDLPSGKYELVLFISNGDDSYAIDIDYECVVP